MDADGWTNAQEPAADTNPFDPNPPDGMIRPDIAHIPAVMGDENGVPLVITLRLPRSKAASNSRRCSGE